MLSISVAYPGFQQGYCLRSGPIRKVRGGGGGCRLHQVRYEKWWGDRGGGGGTPVESASGPIRKVAECSPLQAPPWIRKEGAFGTQQI